MNTAGDPQVLTGSEEDHGHAPSPGPDAPGGPGDARRWGAEVGGRIWRLRLRVLAAGAAAAVALASPVGAHASKIAPGAGVGVGHHLFKAAVASSTLAVAEGAPGDGRVLAIFDTGPGYPAAVAGSSVRQVFPESRALAFVILRVDQRGAGAIVRARACGASGLDGGHLSSGDRASLPGRSTRYRVIWLICPHCGIRVPWLFYDERDIPFCVNVLHGRLELQR